jgi:uncharacterized membrane protein
MTTPRADRRMLSAGLLLGIGLGGMLDGIVLHQILQWHHLLSSRVPPLTLEAMKLNLLADGVFHAATWIVTMVGLVKLVSALRRHDTACSGVGLVGAGLIGWGLFDVVEGVMNHLVLGLHHVREAHRNPWPADLAFLAFGVLLVAAGTLMVARTAWRPVHGGVRLNADPPRSRAR